MRNLIVCCDGTWNTADQKEGGVPVPTNVARLYNSIAEVDTAAAPQRAYYHPGVGTDGDFLDKLAGGAVGAGLGRNVQSAYRWLAGEYEAGDHVFLFGFSRGAYTVRSLAGMIGRCGLLDPTGLDEAKVWKRTGIAYERGYRKREKHESWAKGWSFHAASADEPHVPVHFLGVWDTVGALGIPDDLEVLNVFDDPRKHAFHDTSLGDGVRHARHAVAIDEMRASYTATLWDNADQHADAQEQWFPGVHSDVGGGFRERGLADCALAWMMDEAESCGLAFDAGFRNQVKPDCRDVLHDNSGSIARLLRTQPRSIPHLRQGSRSVHVDTCSRQDSPPINQAPYRKTTVLKVGETADRTIFARQHWNETHLYLEAGGVYDLVATGQWLDRTIPSGPEGTNDGKFHAGEIVHAAGMLLGKVEGLFKTISGNEQADFAGSRREDELPWFCLVGVVANGGNPRPDGTPLPHETFKIGNAVTHSPTKSGYLYCFANDAWHFYGNNRGSLRLKITRRA